MAEKRAIRTGSGASRKKFWNTDNETIATCQHQWRTKKCVDKFFLTYFELGGKRKKKRNCLYYPSHIHCPYYLKTRVMVLFPGLKIMAFVSNLQDSFLTQKRHNHVIACSWGRNSPRTVTVSQPPNYGSMYDFQNYF